MTRPAGTQGTPVRRGHRGVRRLACTALLAGLGLAGPGGIAGADVIQYDAYTGSSNFFGLNTAGTPALTGFDYGAMAIVMADPTSNIITGFDFTITNSTGADITVGAGQSIKISYWLWNTVSTVNTGAGFAFSGLAGTGQTVITNQGTLLNGHVYLYGTWPGAPAPGGVPVFPINNAAGVATPITVNPTTAGLIGITFNLQIDFNDGAGYTQPHGFNLGLHGGNGNPSYPGPVTGMNAFTTPGGYTIAADGSPAGGYFRSANVAGGDGLDMSMPNNTGNFLHTSARPGGAGTNSSFPLRVYAQAAATGACCNTTTGVCSTSTAGGCNSSTSNFNAASACPATGGCTAQGTCCNATTGACSVAYGGAATCPAGALHTQTSCAPGICPPSGACCTGTNNTACAIVLNSNSASCTGTYAGVNTTCSPNACFPADECQTTTWIATVGANNFDSTGASTSTTLAFNLCGIYGPSGGINDVFLRFTPTVSATFKLDTCGSINDTVLSIHSGCPADASNLIACNDDAATTATCFDNSTPGMTTSVLTASLTAGTQYYIRLAGFNGATGPFTINISAPAACCDNDTHACTLTDIVNCGGTYHPLTLSCSPDPCGPPATGVCCRGATCNATVAQSACTAPTTHAGARFVSTASACNAPGNRTTPCCEANYNQSTTTPTITVQDIFDFLADWFSGSPFARVGGDGTGASPTVQSIFDFLSAWFGGGC